MKMGKNSISIADYIRSICSATVFFLLLIVYTPVILLLLLISFGRLTNFIIEKLVPPLGYLPLRIAGIRFNKKYHVDQIPVPAIFIFNHSSTLDVLTILASGFPRVRFVAKWEFQYNPIFLLLGRVTGQVFIKRQNSEKAVETLKKSQERVKMNQLSLLMAPEGSRKHSGVIGSFKKGPFRMAMELDYPVVPVYFEGNRELCEGGRLITRSGNCTAHIHPPLDVSGWSLDNLESHIEQVRNMYMTWIDTEEISGKIKTG